MQAFDLTKSVALSLACVGIVLPHPAVYAAGPRSAMNVPAANVPAAKGLATKGPAAKPPAASDVALGAGGTFRGIVVDGQGIALDGAAVSVRQSGKEVAAAVSNRNGEFQVGNLRGGTYHVIAGEAQGMYRTWAPETAPPSAVDQAMLVSNPEPIIRGQSPADTQEWEEDQEGVPQWDYVKITAFALAGIAGGFAISEAVDNNKKTDDNSNLQNQVANQQRRIQALQDQLNRVPASP